MRFAKSIVLVDDDLDDQEIFKSACAIVDSTIVVNAFESGEQALKNLISTGQTPDLIFLDLNMPRFNGVEVLEGLKMIERLRSVPVIVYTTSFDTKVKVQCLDLGATEIIEKPSSFDLLCQKLETLLQIPA